MDHHQYRVSSQQDAQRLAQEHPGSDPRRDGALGRHAAAPRAHRYATGGDPHAASGQAFAVDLAEFRTALAGLAAQLDRFTGQAAAVEAMVQALPDGSGPVAAIVGNAFNHRLGANGGVSYAVRTNLAQLAHILDGLDQTATNYQQVEQLATDTITATRDGGTTA